MGATRIINSSVYYDAVNKFLLRLPIFTINCLCLNSDQSLAQFDIISG